MNGGSVFILAMLLGCPTPDGCRASDAPSAELGAGEVGYESVADGDEVAIVFGTQGGYHLPLAVDATGLDTSELVIGDFVGTFDDGTEVASAQPWLTFRCNPESESQQTWNVRLIFDAEYLPEDLHGQTVAVEGTLRDARGLTADVAREFTVIDPSQ